MSSLFLNEFIQSHAIISIGKLFQRSTRRQEKENMDYNARLYWGPCNLQERHNRADLTLLFNRHKWICKPSFKSIFEIPSQSWVRGHYLKLKKQHSASGVRHKFFSEVSILTSSRPTASTVSKSCLQILRNRKRWTYSWTEVRMIPGQICMKSSGLAN